MRRTFKTDPHKAEAPSGKELLKKVALGVITDRRRLAEFAEKWSHGFHHYSFLNSLIIWFSAPLTKVPAWRDDQPQTEKAWLLDRSDKYVLIPTADHGTLAAGFTDWRNKHKRPVAAGCVGIPICAPNRIVVEDEDTGEKVSKLIGFKLVYTFDVSQTQGDEPFVLEAPAYTEGERADAVFDELVEVAKEAGIEVDLQERASFAGGSASKGNGNGKVTILNLNGPNGHGRSALTLTHELAHVRLKHVGSKMARDECELEAEAVAWVACEMLGLTVHGAGEYLGGWGATPEKLEAHAERILTAAAWMADRVQKRMEGVSDV